VHCDVGKSCPNGHPARATVSSSFDDVTVLAGDDLLNGPRGRFYAGHPRSGRSINRRPGLILSRLTPWTSRTSAAMTGNARLIEKALGVSPTGTPSPPGGAPYTCPWPAISARPPGRCRWPMGIRRRCSPVGIRIRRGGSPTSSGRRPNRMNGTTPRNRTDLNPTCTGCPSSLRGHAVVDTDDPAWTMERTTVNGVEPFGDLLGNDVARDIAHQPVELVCSGATKRVSDTERTSSTAMSAS
jgi:hypothetical protein